MKEGKMRKFADTQRTDRHGIQTLRPLYPLWILERAGQFADNQRIDKEFSKNSTTESTLILSGYSRELANINDLTPIVPNPV